MDGEDQVNPNKTKDTSLSANLTDTYAGGHPGGHVEEDAKKSHVRGWKTPHRRRKK